MDREVDTLYLRKASLDSLGADPRALNAVAWDRVDTAETQNGTEKTGVDTMTGERRALGTDAPKEKPQPTIKQVVEDGISYDVEVKPDGSEWLVGKTGGQKGVGIRLAPAETGKEEQPGLGIVDTVTDGVKDVGKGLVSGIVKGADEFDRALGLGPIVDWMGQKLDEAGVPHRPAQPETMAGQLAEPLAQGAVVMAPAAMSLKALGVTSQFLQWTLGGAASDMTAFNPDEPGIGELAKDIGKLDVPVVEQLRQGIAEALAKDEDDGEFVKRLKSVGGGVLAGATVDGLTAIFRAAKVVKNVDIPPKLKAALGIGAGGAVLSPEDAQAALTSLADIKPKEEKPKEFQLAGFLSKLTKPFIGKAGREALTNPPASFEARAVAKAAPPGVEEAMSLQWAPYKDADLFGNAPIEGIDFNFDRISTSDAAKEQINNVSRAYEGRILDKTGGVIPLKVTRQVADLLGADEEMAERAIKNLPANTKNLHVKALVMRDMMVKAAESVDARAAKIAVDPSQVTDVELLGFREEVARFAALQANMKGVQTEIARALSSFRIPAEGGQLARAQAVREALDATGGRSTAMELANVWLKTPVKDKGKVAQGAFGKTISAIREVWINGLLSSPRTHEVNLASNFLFTAWQIPERAVAGVIGKARSVLPYADPDRVYTMEAVALAHGFVESIPDALRLGWQVFKTDTPLDQLTKLEVSSHRSISAQNWNLDEASLAGRFVDIVGSGVRLPGRFLMSADEFNKSIGRKMEQRAQAYRLSQIDIENGKTAKEAAETYADVMDGKIESANDAMNDFASTITFTKELGDAGQAIQQAARRVPGMWLIMPFIRTPANIMKEFGRRSPLALAMPKAFWGEIAAGGARRDLALAKLSTGSAAMTFGAYLSGQGILTGGGPSDNKMRKAWLEKYQPYSINMKQLLGEARFKELGLDKEWYPYGRLEPIGTLLGIAADVVEFRQWAPREMADEASPALTARAVGAVMMNLSEKTYLTGLASLAAAYQDPERYGESFVARTAGSMMPFSSIVRDIESAIDPTRRITKRDPSETNPLVGEFYAVLNEYKSRTPGLSNDLPPRLNFWGEEVKQYEGPWVNAFNAFAPKKDKAQPIDDELIRLRYPIAEPSAQIDGVRLTPQQHYTLVKAMNEIAVPTPEGEKTMRGYMNWLVKSATYQAILGDERKTDVIKAVRNKFVDAARAMMLTPGEKHFDADLFAKITAAKARESAGLPAAR